MKILLVGQSWFKKEFEEEGHQVLSIGFPSHLDVLPRYPSINVKLAISEAGLDFVPDVIVIWDNSSPIVLSGLEDYEVPILFYSIDTHHHSHLHQYISVFADETWVAQKDYLNCFADVGRKVEWIPLWASHDVTPKLEKKYGAVFVGTLNKKLNPERVNFFEELSKRSPILVTGGNWNEIFSEAEIVVNQTVKSDLNFRVFEAMMSGCLLLTEKSGNGLYDLFEDGKHLVTYSKNNVEEAAEKINYYLNHKEELKRIAEQGRDEVVSKHSIKARAKFFLDKIINAKKDLTPRSRNFSIATNYSVLARHISKYSKEAELCCLIEVLRSILLGIKNGEKTNQDFLFNFISSALVYDIFSGSTEGAQVIRELRKIDEEDRVLQILDLRSYLNQGLFRDAKLIADKLSPGAGEKLFPEADKVAAGILKTRDELISDQANGISSTLNK